MAYEKRWEPQKRTRPEDPTLIPELLSRTIANGLLTLQTSVAS